MPNGIFSYNVQYNDIGVSIPSKIPFNGYRSAYGIDRQKVIDKQIVDKRDFFFLSTIFNVYSVEPKVKAYNSWAVHNYLGTQKSNVG